MSVRVFVQQPALPLYRVPVFRELARRPDINLHLVYGDDPRGPANVTPDGFVASLRPLQSLIGGRVLWHTPQLTYATRRQSDVFVLSWNSRYLSLPLALLRARRSGVRTVLWGHGYSKNETRCGLMARRRIARLADALLLYDRRTAQRYIDFGFAADRVFVAPNAIDQQPIQTARQAWLDRPEALRRFRQEKGLEEGPVLLYVSRIAPANRLDLLIEAIPSLVAKQPGLRVVLIGKAPPESLAALQRLAQRLDVHENVILPGAIYDENELAPWFLSSTAFVYPANIGLSLLHAFGYGLPVVTSDRTEAQNPEIVALQHEQNGLTYTDSNAASLAAALDRILSDTALRDRLAKEAHRTALHEYTLERMVDGMEAAIRSGDSARPTR